MNAIKTRKSVVLSLLCAVLLLMPVSGFATKYTTQDNAGSKKESPKSDRKKKDAESNAECSRSDKMQIRAFHPRAQEKKAEFDALIDTQDQIDTPKEAEEFTEELEDLQAFYDSEEFALREEQYARCGVEIPRPTDDVPFWMPETGIGEEMDAI